MIKDYLTKWSKSDRDKYHLHMESKRMIEMNLFTKQKQTHRHRKQIYGYQKGKWGRERDKLAFGV